MKQIFKGEITSLNPCRIIKENEDDEVSNFFLVLAVIYNDLKGIILFEKLISDTYEEPLSTDNPSMHIGEYGGLFTQTRKIFIGCLREFFDFLKSNKEILSTPEFQNILNKTNKDIKNRWNNIISIAFDNESKNNSDFTKYLIKVRNNVSFHYNQSGGELKKSFRSYFYKKEKIKYNELAYYAIGENMETTRFFYADAIVQEYMRSTTNNEEEFGIKYKDELGQIIIDMNWTILRLLKAYLKSRPK